MCISDFLLQLEGVVSQGSVSVAGQRAHGEALCDPSYF